MAYRFGALGNTHKSAEDIQGYMGMLSYLRQPFAPRKPLLGATLNRRATPYFALPLGFFLDAGGGAAAVAAAGAETSAKRALVTGAAFEHLNLRRLS